MARPISVLEVTPEEKRELERRVAAPTTPGRDCVRARIVLLRSDGVRQQEVASRLGVSGPSVSKWSQRFDREGLDGLKTLRDEVRHQQSETRRTLDVLLLRPRDSRLVVPLYR